MTMINNNKKVIMRMCVGTREIKSIEDLFRIVKTPSGNIIIEKDEHIEGRGAYISKDINIINQARKKKLLSRALKTEVKDEIYDELIALC